MKKSFQNLYVTQSEKEEYSIHEIHTSNKTKILAADGCLAILIYHIVHEISGSHSLMCFGTRLIKSVLSSREHQLKA